MNGLLRYTFLILIIGLLFSCKSKKKSLSGDDPIEITDFIEFFPEKNLPYQLSDTSLNRKDNDSLRIGNKIFSQFAPDSLLQSVYGKMIPVIYPLARFSGDETYLLVKTVTGTKKAAFVLSFDKKNKYIAGMPVLLADSKSKGERTFVVDKKYKLTRNISRKNADGSVSDGKDVYFLNKEEKYFQLISTDAVDDKVNELINPIDTFSRKQKYTADYGTGKMNLVSFRDGRRADRLIFFMHFEKDNGKCTGELKGEAIMRSATQAVYREAGDPCAIQFNFTSSSVVVKELEGCGSRRGLRCTFDGVYPRKKEIKSKSAKSKPGARKS